MPARAIALILALFILVGIGYSYSTAQVGVTCPGLVEQALAAIGNNCTGLERNSVCYGYNQVFARFTQEQASGFFTQPSDRARLIELENIRTSPMDRLQDLWGIAVMRVQANLPDTLPGQSVVFMLLGDTDVENAVAPEAAFQTETIASVAVQMGANLYYAPDFSAAVVGTVPMGTALTADAISGDGQWVRVVYGGIPGWLTRQVVSSDADLSTLPTIGATPLQAVYFRTSIMGTECTEAPSVLIVQGPRDLKVDLSINGADVRLGSTIALYNIAGDATMQAYLRQQYGDLGAISSLMQLIVLDGDVVLNPDTPDAVELTTGETTFICLGEPQNLGMDGETNDRNVFPGCPWAPPRPVTVMDIERFRSLEGKDFLQLNYPIDLPLDLPTRTPTASPTPTPTGTRVVSSGGGFVPAAATATPTPTPTPTAIVSSGAPPPPPPPPPTDTPVPPCDAYTFPYSVAPGDVADLIGAINAANNETCHPGGDTINLAGGSTYTLASAALGGIGLPGIVTVITINGNTAIIERSFGGGTPNFCLISVSGAGNLTLNDMTLRNGLCDAGAAINQSGGTVTVNNTTFTGNSAPTFITSTGGAISTFAGTLTVNSSTFTGNSTLGGGGAIFNDGTMTVTGSTFTSNTASSGGAITNNILGTATVTGSTFTSNTAGNGGGAIANTNMLDVISSTFSGNTATTGGAAYSTGTLRFISSNSTLSGNTASGDGGGVYSTGSLELSPATVTGNSAVNGGNVYSTGVLHSSGATISFGTASNHGGGLHVSGGGFLEETTISNNTAGGGGGIFKTGGTSLYIQNSSVSQNSEGGGGGSAIYNESSVWMEFGTIYGNSGSGSAAVFLVSGAFFEAHNVLIAGNGFNCSAGITAVGTNFDDDGTCAGFTVSSTLNLSPLASNGGPTQTNAIDGSSAAIDTADCAYIHELGVPITDQRFVGRPQDGNGSPDANECDAGAFEYP
jgi:predicted outer membrane repeat protein